MAIAEPLALEGNDAKPFRCGMLARSLVEAGHEVTWWTSKFDHLHKEYFDRPDVWQVSPGFIVRFLTGRPYGRNVSIARVFHNRDVARALRRDLDSLRPTLDVLFVCIPIHELAEVALDYAAPRNIGVVLDVRDPWPDYLLSAIRFAPVPLTRILLSGEFRRARRNFRRATGITAVSRTYLNWALAYAKRAAGELDGVYPIGYSLTDGAAAPPDRSPPMDKSPDDLVAIFAGSFGASTDLRTVIAAARLLRGRGRCDIKVVLAGDGDERRALESAAAGLDTVEFTGWLERNGLHTALRDADLGLASYRQGAVQSLPNKPFEYWANGLPVIESLGGELKQLVSDAQVGWSYPAGDAVALADLLEWATSHRQEVRRMSSNARKLVRSNFAAEVIYPSLVSMLERVGRE